VLCGERGNFICIWYAETTVLEMTWTDVEKVLKLTCEMHENHLPKLSKGAHFVVLRD